MTTSITIGQIAPNPLHEEDKDEPPFYVLDIMESGPVFTGDVFFNNVYNSRCMAGMQWRGFLEQSGLESFFAMHNIQDENACNRIDWNFVQGLNYVYNKYVQEHRLPPGYGPGRDGTLARFIWLKYWVEYAVRSFQNPGMQIG